MFFGFGSGVVERVEEGGAGVTDRLRGRGRRCGGGGGGRVWAIFWFFAYFFLDVLSFFLLVLVTERM